MSWSQAFFCVVFAAGLGSIVWFFYELIREYRKQNYRRGWRVGRPISDDRRWIDEFKRSLHR